MMKVHIEKGDLTSYDTDAIVNAANNELILGGGLAGTIRRRGGPSIQQECSARGPVAVGQAAITGAGDLPAKHVIHQASMSLGGRTTGENLRSSTEAVLELADKLKLKTIAFPATGTGIAGFDLRKCAEIMLQAVAEHISGPTSLTDVYFVLFDEAARNVFQQVKEEVLP